MECLFFINPRSGAGRGQKLADELESFHFPVAVSRQIVFTDPSRLHSQVYSCASRKDLVIICGGDGTINGIISHLIHLDPPPVVAFIPLGTGNDIARSTGWHDSWKNLGLNGLYHSIKRAETTWLDVWELVLLGTEGQKEHIFVAYAGLGCDGLISAEFANLEKLIGQGYIPPQTRRLFYIPPGLKALFREVVGKSRFDFTISTPATGKRAEKVITASQLLFLNMPSYAGGNLTIREKNFSDGKILCLICKSCLDYFLKIFFSRFKQIEPHASFSREEHFSIRLLHDVYFQKDGEPCGTIKSGTIVTLRHKRILPLLKPLRETRCHSRLPWSTNKEGFKKAPATGAKPVIT